MSNVNDSLFHEQKPNIFSDKGEFMFPNGDKYVGQYLGKKKGRTIVKHGRGCYTTWDGHVYNGFWQNDQLVSSDESEVIFGDGSGYTGSVKNMRLSDYGSYTFPNGYKMTAVFENNSVTRDCYMNGNGEEWAGAMDDEILRLKPIILYYSECPEKKNINETIKPVERI